MKRHRAKLLAGFLILSIAGCASRVLLYDKADEVLKNDEYDKKLDVKVVEAVQPVDPKVKEISVTDPAADTKKPGKGSKKEKEKAASKAKITRQDILNYCKHYNVAIPDIETALKFYNEEATDEILEVGIYINNSEK